MNLFVIQNYKMGKENLNLNETVEMVKLVASSIIESEPLLTDVDRNLGDGDHGLGMERGMNAVLDKISDSTFENISDVFKATGMAMMSSMGGASGALFGTLFRNGGKALEGKEVFLILRELDYFLESANEGVKSGEELL